MLKLFLLFLMLPVIAYGADTFKTRDYSPKEQLDFKMGLERHPEHFKAFKEKLIKKRLLQAEVNNPILASIDLTAKVSPPENQGGCGSCWAFGLTKALRSALMLVGIDPGVLSFNFLLNNCGPGPRMYGCGGGDFDAGESFLNGFGPWLESQDPYTQREGRCKTGLAVAGTAISMEVVGNGKNPPTFQELAQAIANNHMLVIDGAVCGAWGNYNGGILNRNDCGAGGINHMINRVGYDCQTSVKINAEGKKVCDFNVQGNTVNGDGYFNDENNWGTSWGEKGYIRIKWYIDAWGDTAMYFVVKKAPIPPGPEGKEFSIENDVAKVAGTVKAEYVKFYDNIVTAIKEFIESFK